MPAKNVGWLVLAMVMSASAQVKPSAAPGGQKLPLQRVILYKSGVGYFEHEGEVQGSQDVEIDLTGSQLNDVLKSLTALDLSGGRIVGANYNSQDPASHQLDELSVPVGRNATLPAMLTALRGAELEVQTGATTFSGRLLSVDQEAKQNGNTQTQVTRVALMTDRGEVRSFDLESVTSLRFADHDLDQRLSRALGLLNEEHAADTRRLVISTAGQGSRQLRVSYISEVPVWKTTYRIVLPSASSSAKPLLQGWAIVDNTVGEDWTNVELSLAAGAPQSFIEQLSQPYYARRAVVPLPQQYSTAPQTHEATLNAPAGVTDGTADAAYERMVAGPARAGGGAGGRGGAGSPSAAFAAQMAIAGNVDDTEFNLAQSIDVESGSRLGDLFQYNIRDHVTIPKNQSAMVPIVNTNVSAEKVSLWNGGSSAAGHPLRALWLTNSSAEVLDGGSFSIVDGDAFAGEGIVDSIQPGERRLISYAIDLGVLVSPGRQNESSETVTRVKVAHGLLVRIMETKLETTYTIRNEDTTPREVIVEHSVRSGYKLSGAVKPKETTATSNRFRVSVDAKKTATLTLEESRQFDANYEITNLDSPTILAIQGQRTLAPGLDAALHQVLARKDALAKLESQISEKQSGIQSIADDQARIRANLQSLKGTPEEKALAERYTKELDDQETQLAGLRKDLADLQSQADKAQSDLGAYIENLTFDTSY